MVLSLKYSDLSSTISESNKLSKELGQYCDGLSKKVQQNMYSVTGGKSTALDSADYFVKAKITQLRAREKNAQNLSTKTQTLLDTAKRVDDDVKKMIEANQKSFFKKNPDLKPSAFKLAVTSFLCDWKNSPALSWLIKGGEQLACALDVLKTGIVRFWEENKDTLIVIGIIVLTVVVAVLCIVSGGLPAIIGAGLIVGLLSQLISDVASGKMSTWEKYVGSTLGGAAGMVAGAYGGWALGGAVSGGTSTFITSVLENWTGRASKSAWEITTETMISAAVSGVISWGVGKAFNAPIAKSIMKPSEKWLASVVKSGTKTGILTGSGNMMASFHAQMTNLAKGTLGQGLVKNITQKTVKNLIVGTIADSIKSAVRKKTETAITNFTMKNVVLPIVDKAKKNSFLAPIFEFQRITPDLRGVKSSIDNIKKWNSKGDVYHLSPAM